MTESTDGVVYAVGTDGSRETWLDDDRLDTESFDASGITQDTDGNVYVAVTRAATATGRLLQVPVQSGGCASAGEASTLFDGEVTTLFDGEAIFVRMASLPVMKPSSSRPTARIGSFAPNRVISSSATSRISHSKTRLLSGLGCESPVTVSVGTLFRFTGMSLCMAPRTPLLHPDRFFAERPRHLGRIALVLGLVVFTGLGTVYGIGYLLVTHVDGTVMVDNPERPPEVFCDSDMESVPFDESDCDAPQQVERDVDSIIWDAIGELSGPMLGGILILLVGLTIVVHAGSWLAGGTNGVAESFAVTVWGLAPMVVVIPVSMVVVSVVLEPVTLSAAQDPSSAFAGLERQLRAHQWIGTVSTVVSSLWSAAIWRYGLEHERGVSGAAATAIAGAVALLVIIGGTL